MSLMLVDEHAKKNVLFKISMHIFLHDCYGKDVEEKLQKNTEKNPNKIYTRLRYIT